LIIQVSLRIIANSKKETFVIISRVVLRRGRDSHPERVALYSHESKDEQAIPLEERESASKDDQWIALRLGRGGKPPFPRSG
jgi:hypothetical protein